MALQAPPVLSTEPELHLLPEWGDEERGRRTAWAATGTAIVHIAFFFAAIALNEYLPPPTAKPVETADVRKAVKLFLPQELLTQREPNRSKVAKELKLENLLPRPHVQPSPKFSSPPPAAAAPRASVPVPTLEAPPVAIAQAPPPLPGTTPNLPGPPVSKPPQIQSEEKPKLAFETPGLPSVRPSGASRIEAPKAGIQDAIRSASQPRPDLPSGDPGIGQLPGQSGSSPRQMSTPELLSDPMGVDFKPYLVRVLAAVRRNWMSVIPESARLGGKGKVVLVFSIDRVGSVPKLVIAMPSGTEAFDRAAVAGVSASNPFPPLPPEFRGNEIRVQLAFFYNVPSR